MNYLNLTLLKLILIDIDLFIIFPSFTYNFFDLRKKILTLIRKNYDIFNSRTDILLKINEVSLKPFRILGRCN